MLARTSLQKMFREHFGMGRAHKGLDVPATDQLTWLEDLAEQLSTEPRVETKVRDEDFLILGILPPTTRDYNPEWFILSFAPVPDANTSEQPTGLWITDATYRRKHSGTAAPVEDVARITDFIAAVKNRQDQTILRKQRSVKLANLKQRSLKSRLIELGKQHDFAFAIGESKRDVRLSIRVGGKRSAYHMSFPKGKLDAVLEEIPNLVETLTKLRELGVNFRSNNRPWELSQGAWLEPSQESVSDDQE